MSLATELVALREDRERREQEAAARSRQLIDALFVDHFAIALKRLPDVAKEAARRGARETALCVVDEVAAVGERDEFGHFVSLRPWTPSNNKRDYSLFRGDAVRLSTVNDQQLLVKDSTGWIAADELASVEVIQHAALRRLWVELTTSGLQPFFRNRDPLRHGRTELWIRLP